MSGLEIAIAILMLVQAVLTIQVVSNLRYALKTFRRDRRDYLPKCLLIVPCKGIDETFERNIRSFFEQAYPSYRLWFVVDSATDPAYGPIETLCRELGAQSAHDTQILVAGQAEGCSQKLHNLLYACRKSPEDTEVLVFADSDACAGPSWLSHIVHPLRQEKTGAASGYRWFVPGKNNSASIALSAVNAKVCQLLGNTRFNLAWGGSMAIRMDRFRELGIESIWSKSLSDDLSLSRAVQRAGLKMVFVPACMIASYESATWSGFYEFARRQFVITRVYAPGMWRLGLFGASMSVFGLWGGAALAIWQLIQDGAPNRLFILFPFYFLGCLMIRAILRQRLGAELLPHDRENMKAARWADWLLFWLWDLVLLVIIVSSAFGNVIVWRNIRYRLHSPTKIETLH